MNDDDDGRPPLEPARPDAAESEGRPSYAPRLPWKWIIVGVVGVGLLFASYYVRRGQRQEALREQMLALLQEERFRELSERYLGFRRELEEKVVEAVEGGEPETYVDPRLNISGLRAGEGLYLRVPADFVTSQERVEGAAMAMEPDAIMRCLGLAPTSARGVYEKGYFLTPSYEDEIRREPDMMELRVMDDQLGRHVQVDAPVVASMLQADWFMLVVQRGETRAESPVDVFLWDLRRDQQLLRARIQGRGLLVPVRLRFDGVNNPEAPGRPQVRSAGATDCSIASQIRALAGGETLDFESGAAVLEAAAEGGEDEGGDEPEAGADEASSEAAAPSESGAEASESSEASASTAPGGSEASEPDDPSEASDAPESEAAEPESSEAGGDGASSADPAQP